MDEITDRVKIADILDDIGYPHGRNRCACPIHDGTNKTAMSFTDWGFTCFNCGASGGLIDLVIMLKVCTRLEAYRYLRRLAGLPVEPLPANWKPGKAEAVPFSTRGTKQDNPEWLELEAKVDDIERRRCTLLDRLVNARADSCKSKYYKDREITVSLDQWYRIEQNLQYQLAELDEQHAYWNCKFRQTKRRLD